MTRRETSGTAHFDVKREPVDLVHLVREALERLEGTFEAAGSKVTFTTEVAAVVGHWDGFRLDQVVTNLLTNAAKYGAGQPVDVTVCVDGDHALLVVRDRGIGIAPEQVERIFGKFERAVSDRHYGGLGLGLFIAQQILAAHGGEIRVGSEPGRGATFTVLLPLLAPAAKGR